MPKSSASTFGLGWRSHSFSSCMRRSRSRMPVRYSSSLCRSSVPSEPLSRRASCAKGIEHAGPADELGFALVERLRRIGPEELIEEDVRPILGGHGRAAGAPGKGLILIAAEAGAAFDAQGERRKPRLPADRLGQFLVAGDAKPGAGAARVGAGEEGAVADVAAGVGQLQAGDDGEVAPQGFERFEDRRDGVIQARVRGGEIAAVDAQAEEAEDGAARRFEAAMEPAVVTEPAHGSSRRATAAPA